MRAGRINTKSEEHEKESGPPITRKNANETFNQERWKSGSELSRPFACFAGKKIMDPVDYRNLTWQALSEKVAGARMAVWIAWCKHGPGTTREVAEKSGIDILTFRPRTTELFDLGFVELVPGAGRTGGRTHGGSDRGMQRHVAEGVYRAIQWNDAKTRFETRAAHAKSAGYQQQLQLK